MKISSEGLQLCAGIRGFKSIKGLKAVEIDENSLKTKAESIRQELFDEKMIVTKTDDENSLVFSALGELIINVMAQPDVWLSFDNTEVCRYVHIKDEIYIYTVLIEGYYYITLLPALPLVFGACADAMDDKEKTLYVEGESNNTVLKLTIDKGEISVIEDGSGKTDEEDELFINKLIQWIIFGLKDVERKGVIQA